MVDIFGDASDNNLFGTSGDDRYFGFGGFDLLFASTGNDLLDGGPGRNVAIYENSAFVNGVFINGTSTAIGTVLAHMVDKRGFGTDTLIDIENFHGSNFNDTIHVGGSGGTYTFDRAGDDLVVASQDPNAVDGHLFIAGSGNDTYIGTASRDRVDFDNDNFDGAGPLIGGVNVDLAAGTAVDGWGDTDTLVSIERIDGTRFNDTIRGDTERNEFRGMEGDDLLDGRGGARDRARYDRDPSAVVVDLFAGTATDGWGDTDTLLNIEEITGSDFDDTLRGDNAANLLRGEGGNDLLQGLGGDDNFDGGNGSDTIDGGDGFDVIGHFDDTSGVLVDLRTGLVIDGWGNTDTLISIEGADGSPHDDTLNGDDDGNFLDGREGNDLLQGFGGNDTFRGSQGDDTIDGGLGQDDRVEYHRDAERGGGNGVLVNLVLGQATDGFGDTDTLIGIENAQGTHQNDTFIGNDDNNEFWGMDGDDYFEGGIGGDFFTPGAGADTIIGGSNGALGEQDHLFYGFSARNEGYTTGISVVFTNETDGSVLDYAGFTDVFSGIEIVEGTHFDDVFVGADGQQEFRGLAGNDNFDGGAGDRDRINYRWGGDESEQSGVTVDMVLGTATDRYGDTDTFVNIEEVRGSIFDDVITGNSLRNELFGEEGDDRLDSFGGVENYLNGGSGNDTIDARGINDWAEGGDGNDLITLHAERGGSNPGLGSDTVVGSAGGEHFVSYRGIGEAVIIDAAIGTASLSGGDVDTLINVRNFQGGDGDDQIFGDDIDDVQWFHNSFGNDFIDGRGGFDRIEYDRLGETSVTVNFITGTVTAAVTGTDTFVNIEEARGSDGNDFFIGNDDDNQFRGMDGVDDYKGGLGFDSISFSSDRFNGGMLGVTVDLGAGTNTDGWGNSETNAGIERVVATDFDDMLIGSEGNDRLIGIEGNDILIAGGGDDGLYAGGGIDTVTGGAGADDFGGRVWELDGDTFTDFGAEDVLQVFDEDFNLIGADVTISGGQMRIDTTGDGIPEAVVTLTNGFSGPVNVEGGSVSGPGPSVLSVQNAGLFTAAVTEDNRTIQIVVERSGDLTSTASVDVTVTGSGSNPADASDISSPFGTVQVVTFAPGATTATLAVVLAEDTDIEADEDLVVTLTNPQSDGAQGPQLGGAETFVRILNDDFPETVSITGGKAPEDSGALLFTIARTGDTSTAITVDYDIRSAGGVQGAEASDLVAGLPQSGSVVIPAGASSVTLSVGIVPDLVAELHDDVIVRISDGGDWPSGLTMGTFQATGSIRNDDGIPPLLPPGATAANYGDPHIITLDGLAYDFQAVGEFTLITAQSGDPLNVQVRFQPVPGSEVASQTTAVATVMGNTRIVVDTGSADLVKVDGVAFDPGDAIGGTALGDGALYFDGEALTFVYANGEQLRVDLFDGFLSTSVSVAEGRDVRGLLGNFDGDTANDLALADGTVLPQPIAFETLYGAFADSWRIEDATSLFDYANGTGTANFTDLSFPRAAVSLDDFPVELVAQAMAAAAGIDNPDLRDAAVLDYLLSGDAAFIAAADVVEEDISAEIVDTVAPENAPELASAMGITASVAEITEGDSDAQPVTFTIYRTGDASQALTVSYTLGGDVTAQDVGSVSGGVLDFAAGEMAKTLSYSVLGDLVPELDETLTVAFSVNEDSRPLILSSVAKVKIIDDDIGVVAADDSFATDEDTVLTGNLLADNGAGADFGEGVLSITGVSIQNGPAVVLGAVTDLGDGATLQVTETGDFTFDPGEAYQALNAGDEAAFAFSYTLTDGTTSDTGSADIAVSGLDDTPLLNPIEGTGRSDLLRGTVDADEIVSFGGRFDKMFGAEGADVFVFGAETRNGQRERDVILDFEAGVDTIRLEDHAAVASIRETSKKLVIFFEGDGDALYLRGPGLTAEDVTIIDTALQDDLFI